MADKPISIITESADAHLQEIDERDRRVVERQARERDLMVKGQDALSSIGALLESIVAELDHPKIELASGPDPSGRRLRVECSISSQSRTAKPHVMTLAYDPTRDCVLTESTTLGRFSYTTDRAEAQHENWVRRITAAFIERATAEWADRYREPEPEKP